MADMPYVTIIVGSTEAVTTGQAAQERGITVAAMRRAISVNGIEPLAYLDGRTPLYDPVALYAALDTRPGRGAPGRSRRTRT